MGRFLYVTECESRLHFLVETGSEGSTIPPSKTEGEKIGFLAANKLPIVTYWTRWFMLNLGLCRTFWWVFMVTNVCNPILGADFLKYYDLVVDMRCRRLLDIRTQLFIQGVISSSTSLSSTLLQKKPTNDFTAIMAEFPTITRPCSKDRTIKHDIMHIHLSVCAPEG